MNKYSLKKWVALLLLTYSSVSFSQTTTTTQKYEVQTVTDGKYSYQTVTNDPLKARIYTLPNGLKVYLTVYKDAPRIQTYIAVRAGSKNDPSTATGLAHYLEHMLFKGTSSFGTLNWEKEKPLLLQIENIYETYRKTTDVKLRKKLYHQIDSISGVAATFAIANEYDKMLGAIGAEGTNAYTSVEQTVYVNDIPSNQVERWAQIEANRFGEFVPRLFHTELEAVYEEKNRGLDNDRTKVWEAIFSGLYPKHQYGTQTTIGTVEHLKNPSIKEIKKYFDAYYVPNNMAICMSGDINPEETIALIDKYFGVLKPKSVPSFKVTEEAPITVPVVKTVLGPDAESVSLSFRGGNIHSRESLLLEMVSTMLSNSQAGLIDLNLNQQQKLMGGHAFSMRLKDYSAITLGGKPKAGQTLEQVRDLLLGQLELIKKGDFDDNLMQAVINDYKISTMRSYEENKNRADAFVDAFILDQNWTESVAFIDNLAKLTKKDIVDFSNTFFKNNYVIVYKRTGVDSTIKKVEKPQITPVTVNRESQSMFYKYVMAQEASIMTPVFVDYEKDITKFALKNGTPVHYKVNQENGIFNLYYQFELGSNSNPKIGIALSYLKYLGINGKDAETLQKDFYNLGCSYDVMVGENKVYFTLSGLNENLAKALPLFEEVLKNPLPNEDALKELVSDILKSKADAKRNKKVILNSALVSYAKYGKVSPFTSSLKEAELKNLSSTELITLIKSLSNYKHKVLFYGTFSTTELTNLLNTSHATNAVLAELPPVKNYVELDFTENEVLWVNYDMVQAELMILSKSLPYNYSATQAPIISMYNEYFGGGMSSIVFQEIRESKALAYACKSNYSQARELGKSNYNVSYIGTQADKLKEALAAMQDLLKNMPEASTTFNSAKEAIVNSIETQRITKQDVLINYENALMLGQKYDVRADIYNGVKKVTFADIVKFQKENISNAKQKILVIGSKDKLDFSVLQQYGKVREVTLEEIFGY